MMTFEKLDTAKQYYEKVLSILDSKLENNLLSQQSEVDLIGMLEVLNNLIAIKELYPAEKEFKCSEYFIVYKMNVHILLGDFVESTKDCLKLLEITENKINTMDQTRRILFPELLDNEKRSAIRLERLIDKLQRS